MGNPAYSDSRRNNSGAGALKAHNELRAVHMQHTAAFPVPRDSSRRIILNASDRVYAAVLQQFWHPHIHTLKWFQRFCCRYRKERHQPRTWQLHPKPVHIWLSSYMLCLHTRHNRSRTQLQNKRALLDKLPDMRGLKAFVMQGSDILFIRVFDTGLRPGKHKPDTPSV